ncbi:hypothetical protein TWF225_011549 [Orbilia oligospora]|uniref:Uncharacterized protein n=1 Tax=Orbilia oligospora TaxID=2813651 RepID=A0A7C8KDI5_ORBOL|nr:hypothetical protein TWF751_011772 [Orbilia oligospora]KAF3192737.1 hypothetical protein TWF225_011549 [Orbilia oligospora]KAF3262920.1 hypothetical protein TWF217_004196 [Orbilia oligospora]KAF3264012.1 hypothetical protein TWF128_001641 [Orbilia oligospora]KAF3264013.1 hypothetical protein TWF128_001641 [Orbilia oligospora]
MWHTTSPGSIAYRSSTEISTTMENAESASTAYAPPPPHSSPLPAPSLPKHLRYPSNPPPIGPLPRPPSILENQQIGARLSASSPPLSASIHPRLIASPFPTLPEIQGQEPSEPFHNTSNPKGSLTTLLTPSNSLPYNSDSPSPVGRQPSAHTQASSDALGEIYLPSKSYPLTLSPLDRGNQVSSAVSEDYSTYSGSSLLCSHEETAPLPSRPTQTFHFDPNVVPLEDLQQDSHSLRRLSRLSYINGGTAFMVSEESDDLQRNVTSWFYRINNVLPEFEGQQNRDPAATSPRDINTRFDYHINSTLGSPGDSSLRIHPADNRFEYTYRIRKASETEEPIYVPVYSFEPPGKFPHRSRLTAPLATPKFLNHTPRNFSLPGRPDGDSVDRSSSDSAEMLLGDTRKSNGIGQEIKVPLRAYDAQGRALRPFRSSLAMKSPGMAPSLPARNKIKCGIQSYRKETVHQRFEREHSHYFQDLSHLEESHWPAVPIPPRVQIHGPKFSFSKYGVPTLRRPSDSYTGKEINKNRWPERYKRQKRIGRSLLCMCIAMPPLWLVMSVGLLDNLVAETTSGEIWGVGRVEKTLAAWFGGIFCFALIVTIIVVGIIVL